MDISLLESWDVGLQVPRASIYWSLSVIIVLWSMRIKHNVILNKYESFVGVATKAWAKVMSRGAHTLKTIRGMTAFDL